MSSKYHDKQKSLKRRFLLILGVVTFISVCTLGGMFIFWDRFRTSLGLPQWQMTLFGALFIGYGLLRFSRLFKKDEDEA